MASGEDELGRFVGEALARGVSRAAIGQALTQAGWTAEQGRAALAAWADVEFPVPVPRPRPQFSARDAFLYLLLFTTLYISAFNLGKLLFDLIDWALPDAAMRRYHVSLANSMRWSIASIVVAFPVFLLLAARTGRELAQQPIRRLSPVRRWLTYLTLFLAGTVLICDLIVLVYSVLGGELTLRFVLKVIVVAVISAVIFGYYVSDARRDDPVP